MPASLGLIELFEAARRRGEDARPSRHRLFASLAVQLLVREYSWLLDLNRESSYILHAAGAHPHVDLPRAEHREEFALRLVVARSNRLRDDLRRCHAHLLHHRREHDLIGGDRLAAAVANLDRGCPLSKAYAVQCELKLV